MYKEINNIKIFHDDVLKNNEDYNSQGLENLFLAEEKHFWFLARKEFIAQQMSDCNLQQSKIIEIGAGTGGVTRHLIDGGFSSVAVGEMHLNGLEYARSYGISECYQFDLLRTPFENEFDTVCMFDVLEHIKDSRIALINVHKMLSENGHIIITVPAHKWLWNRDDAIAGHKNRYTKKELITELKNNGFDPIVTRYFFISIIPLLLIRCFLNKDNGLPIENTEYSKKITINPLVNKILLCISRLENKLNQYLPNWFGGSLFVIARKNDSL